MSFLKKISSHFPFFKDQGIDHVVAAGKGGLGLMAFSVTSGGTPDAVLFSTYGFGEMADTNYQVLVNGETVAATKVDENTKTTKGFSILGGGAAEVLHVVVVGRLKGMPAS